MFVAVGVKSDFLGRAKILVCREHLKLYRWTFDKIQVFRHVSLKVAGLHYCEYQWSQVS